MKKKLYVLLLSVLLALATQGESQAVCEDNALIKTVESVKPDDFGCIVNAERTAAELNNKGNDSSKNEEEQILELLTSESWIEIYKGDEYCFNLDKTGTHGRLPITYEIKDDVITTVEGAAGTTKATLQIVERNGRVILVPITLVPFNSNGQVIFLPNESDSYYAAKSDYDVISEEIREEHTVELTSHEAWAVRKDSQFVMYYMFSRGGGGCALLYAGSYALEWEFVDNNTLKITVITDRRQSSTYDIVVEKGTYKLISTVNSNVVATPHN